MLGRDPEGRPVIEKLVNTPAGALAFLALAALITGLLEGGAA